MTNKLVEQYKTKKKQIKKRLKEFKQVGERSDKKIFAELCFCICTPQSRAVFCNKAISNLERSGMLYTGNLEQIRFELKAVRFPNNKAKFIFEARKTFSEKGKLLIKSRVQKNNIHDSREWIVNNVKGIGFKEASHFLRNMGLGKDLAILDVHILRNMVRYKVISEIPKTITKKIYYCIEDKIKDFSGEIDIPMDELDLLLWSNETGKIFK